MHILVATGGSTHSQTALQQCLMIAALAEVEVTVLTVVEHEDQPQADALLREATAFLSPGVRLLRTKQRVGQPVAEIITETTEGSYDLLIMGDKAQHSLLTRLMGPTAQQVVAQVHCPVLLARQEAHTLRRILICDGGALTPPLTDRFATHLPQILEHAEDVTVLHVMSQISAAPGIPGQDLRADAQELINAQTPEGEWLSRDLEILDQVEIEATPMVRHGLVVDEILAEATDGSYDLIVVGAHPSEGWHRFLLENVTAKIVIEADRPVLVIP
ncbi:MAG: universal stress protein [Candidatus Promineifilaceae bacterium]|nr:universal stress protein [Candidatus Promineifilaceae bacterium]